VLLVVPEAVEEAVVAEVLTTVTTSLILVLTLPIILVITFTLKVEVVEVVKAQVVTVVQAAQVIVLMLMVTMVIIAEHLLVDQEHLMGDLVGAEQANQVAPEVQVVTEAVITMLVGTVVQVMAHLVKVVGDLVVVQEQSEHTEQVV
jgi:hypothetical protein